MTSFFADAALVQRIERAAARLTEAGGRAAQRRRADAIVSPLSGGVAVFTGESSPFDKVAGLGFEALDEAALARHEDAVRGRGAVQVELASRADAGIAKLLCARGYALIAFEDVLGLPLASRDDDRASETSANANEIAIAKAMPGEIDVWIDTLVTGFAHADSQGAPSHEDFPRDAIVAAMHDTLAGGAIAYLARRDGEIVGGASMCVSDDVAQLTGAATLAAHRRLGVQTALTRARLADAARAGAVVATVTTLPGSKSQENAVRGGFSILYTRAVFTK